jgi:hypothetical protein
MIARSCSIVALLVLAGCGRGGSALPQGAAGPRGGPPPNPIAMPSVYALLGERERLQLSAEQIAELDSIGEWSASESQRIERALRDLGVRGPIVLQDSAPSSGSAPLSAESEAGRLIHELASVTLRATEGVENVLDSNQRAVVCSLQDDSDARRLRESARDGRREPRATPSRPRGPSGAASMRRVGWPWCSPPRPAPSGAP